MTEDLAVDYRLLFEKSSGLYLVLDTGLRIVSASDNYCRGTHRPRDALIGRSILDLFPDEVGGAVRTSLESVRSTLRPDAMAIFRQDIAGDGGAPVERHWSALNVPVVDDGGTLRLIIHRVHDVTRAVLEPQTDISRRKLAEEQDAIIQRLRTANEELAQLDGLRQGLEEMSRLNTISLMASALAHDVSQPLTAARNYLGALRRNWPAFDEGRAEDVLGKISAQIDRASEIVKGLRALMSAGATVHRPESIAALIGAAAKLARSSFEDTGATLTLDVPSDLPAVPVDRVQILQLLVCLLENAAEATAGEPAREVVVSAREADGRMRVSVADTGVGLPEDIAAMLADSFAATRLIGSGLGLPIARQVLKTHDSELRAAPNMPRGTVFSFDLPIRVPDMAPAG